MTTLFYKSHSYLCHSLGHIPDLGKMPIYGFIHYSKTEYYTCIRQAFMMSTLTMFLQA